MVISLVVCRFSVGQLLELGDVVVVIDANLSTASHAIGYHVRVTSVHGPGLLLVHRLDPARGLIKCRDRRR